SFTFGAGQYLADSRFNQRDSQPDSSLLFCQAEVQFRLTALKIKTDLPKRNSLLVFGDEQEASILANFLGKPCNVSFPRNRSRRERCRAHLRIVGPFPQEANVIGSRPPP